MTKELDAAPGDIRALKHRIHELEGEVIGYKRILDGQGKAEPVAITHVGAMDHGPFEITPTAHGCDHLKHGDKLYTQAVAHPSQARCQYCDDTGDVHTPAGEWRGECTQCNAAAEHAFKNFHAQLCARFNYEHDPIDWKRDQVSLIEHIAKLTTAQPSQAMEPDMFWNHDDAEKLYDSVDEFLNDEICNGTPLEVGDIRTIQCAIRLPNFDIRVTAVDDEECEAEYEVIAAINAKGAA